MSQSPLWQGYSSGDYMKGNTWGVEMKAKLETHGRRNRTPQRGHTSASQILINYNPRWKWTLRSLSPFFISRMRLKMDWFSQTSAGVRDFASRAIQTTLTISCLHRSSISSGAHIEIRFVYRIILKWPTHELIRKDRNESKMLLIIYRIA